MRLLPVLIAAATLSTAAAQADAAPLRAAPPPAFHGPAHPFDATDDATRIVLSYCRRAINGAYGFWADVGWITAQSFTASKSGTLTHIVTGMTGNFLEDFTVTATLYTDDGYGHPGTLLATSAPTTVVDPPDYPQWRRVDVTFPTDPASLTAGGRYVIKWTGNLGAGSAGYVVVHEGAPGCSGGHLLQSVDNEQTWYDYSDVDQVYGLGQD